MKMLATWFSSQRQVRGRAVRYVKCIEPVGKPVCMISMPEGEFYRMGIVTGDILEVDALNVYLDDKDPTISRIDDANVTVVAHLMERVAFTFSLEEMTFYDEAIRCLRRTGGRTIAKCWIGKQLLKEALPELEGCGHFLNKVKRRLRLDEAKEAFLMVEGNFEVFFRDEGATRVYFFPENLSLKEYNLLPIRDVIIKDEEAKRLKEIAKYVREKYHGTSAFTVQSLVQLVLTEFKKELTEKEIKQMVWQSDYDEEYWTYLRDKVEDLERGVAVYRGGFLFQLPNGIVAWETPAYGAATYIVRGTVEEAASKLAGFDTKIETLQAKAAKSEEMEWLVGRAIHYELDGWKENIEALLKEAEVKPPFGGMEKHF